jgi:hypothetical protein
MADRQRLLMGSKIEEIEKWLIELADLVRSQHQEHGSSNE